MNKMHKKYNCITFLLVFLCFLAGCSKSNQKFEYTYGGVYFERPSFTEKGKYELALTTQTNKGTFHIITDKNEEADTFVNAQMDLLSYLEKNGVDLKTLNYYVSDYDDTFSDSANDSAYIGLMSIETYEQVLVTLQSLWGDYIDYGYLYALSNRIAEDLKWEVDDVPEMEDVALDKFFTENVSAMNLLYPCFSSEYASEETIENCKALSAKLLKDTKLKQTLKRPIEELIAEFRLKVDGYAERLKVEFERNECKYAYNGEYIPLKILTVYAEYLVDKDFTDATPVLEEYMKDYCGIFQAMQTVNDELVGLVEMHNLTGEVDLVTYRCLSKETTAALGLRENVNKCYSRTREIYLTSLKANSHEFLHCIYYDITRDYSYGWQSEGFCEIGRADSHFWNRSWENMMQLDNWRELFENYTGHIYTSNKKDFYESCDIYCYVFDDYDYVPQTGGAALDSFTNYLISLYGQETIIELYLYPDKVVDAIGKTWDKLTYEWKVSIIEKYDGYTIPEWVYERKRG